MRQLLLIFLLIFSNPCLSSVGGGCPGGEKEICNEKQVETEVIQASRSIVPLNYLFELIVLLAAVYLFYKIKNNDRE